MLQTFYRSRGLPDIFHFVDDILNSETSNLKTSSMSVDLLENPQSFVLKADLPGVQKEDIQVDFKDGYLTVSVESKAEKEVKEDEKVLRLERSFQKKTRTFQFDDLIIPENITASYENGVLTLNLPKKEQQESVFKIEIK
jgi:HSP20 family protein